MKKDGRQKGLESLGRPANEYVKKKFWEDNNSKISLTTDGIDLSNADVGEKVGDKSNDGYNDYRKDLRIEMVKAKIAKPLTKFPSKTYTEKELQETIDKIGKGYIEITRDNGEKLRLKEIEAELKERKKDKVSYDELIEIMEKIKKDQILDMINY